MNEFEALMPKAEGEDVGSKYRYVFSSSMGREVLSDILTKCHFGSTLDPDNKAQIGELNIGILILAECGILGPDTKMDVVNALCNVLPKGR